MMNKEEILVPFLIKDKVIYLTQKQIAQKNTDIEVRKINSENKKKKHKNKTELNKSSFLIKIRKHEEKIHKMLTIYLNSSNEVDISIYKNQIKNANLRCKRKGIKGSFSLDEWLSLLAWQQYKCANCNLIPSKLTIDHIIAISKGGTNDIDNIQALCYSCNHQKADFAIDNAS